MPSQLKENKKGKKQIDKALKDLVNFEFILASKKTGEIHVSLNPRKRKEIYEFIDKYDRGYN